MRFRTARRFIFGTALDRWAAECESGARPVVRIIQEPLAKDTTTKSTEGTK